MNELKKTNAENSNESNEIDSKWNSSIEFKIGARIQGPMRGKQQAIATGLIAF